MTGSGTIVQRLHRIWRQREDVESSLARGPRQIAAAAMSLAAAKADLLQHRELVKSKRMEADRKQLQMRQREQRLYEMEVQMNTCKGDREYQTLKMQIAADKQANSVLTDEILELLEEIDSLQRQTQGFVDRETAQEAEVKRVETAVDDRKAQLEADLGKILAELKEAEEDLQGDLRPAYKRLIGQLGADAIAALEGESCGGCNTTLAPRTVDQLEMNQSILCTSCGRLLYSPRG